jgi:hypothetical protein
VDLFRKIWPIKILMNTIAHFIKTLFSNLVKRFRPEEIFFGLTTIFTVIVEYSSVVPSLFMLCLLAFYYMFFGWFMFSTKNEKHALFSIISGVLYSICLLSIAVILLRSGYEVFFYVLQFIVLMSILLFLFNRKTWGIYKENHYIRIGLILFLNICIYIFR